MNQKGNEEKVVNIANVGNLTKNAVENFEENIVKQKDYLEKVWVNEVPYMNDKFH
ncbi:hypothetical protein [Clostridium sp.]